MIHALIGKLGHFFVIVSFVAALLATISFFINSRSKETRKISSIYFYIHVIGILGVFVTLFLIINRHYFEYHYAWSHSSKYLPIYYQISSFWNGQEGSFLLWMFWNAILGVVLLNTNKFWKAPVMAVMSLTQVFLTSMILGIVFFPEFKLGSSPFLLLRDVIDDAIFKINPNFIPEDGSGLNPLLQNYWMVIHPPTLFLGFASTVIPFAYCIAGLATGKVKEWIRPALPWALFSAVILGIGILMGAYWAYETLNFGGYWNWDPVENAIYVPWLIMVAAIHTMIAYKKSGAALKASVILVISTFILILYSTFLTRSGVLGETSVHSFTDLGLQGQLLIYLFAYLIFSTILCVVTWKKFPKNDQEVSTYSREFWIFLGATLLCLMGFQVIIPTSIPVFNEIMQALGFESNVAPPVDQVAYYTKFQLWFAIGLAILSGTGQFFWWKKIDRESLKKELTTPITITLIISIVILLVGGITNFAYILLLVTSIYSIVANGKILLGLRKTNFKLAGGSLAHIGLAMMILGILYSSGYSKIISKNNTGMLWSKEFPDEVNQNNLLLFLNEPRQMGEYSLLFRGERKLIKGIGYVDINSVKTTTHPLKLVATKEIYKGNRLQAKRGDTLRLINGENSYYEVLYSKANGKTFTLFPRVQMNEQMGTVLSPDINRTLTADLYTHIRTFPDPEQEIKWSENQEVKLKAGDIFFINDYVATFLSIERVTSLPDVNLKENDIAVKAIIEIQGEYDVYRAEPSYVIRENFVGRIPFEIPDLACKISLQAINPQDDTVTFSYQTTQKDWIILEAVEKPLINVLWLGTFLLVIGFVVAIQRRYTEFMSMRDKDME